MNYLSNQSIYFAGKSSLVRPDGVSFWKFLRSEKIPYKKNDFAFLTSHSSPRIKTVYDAQEFFALNSRGQALAYLYNGLGKALDYVGPVLDTELKHGFNDHTDRHTLWVSQTGVELLQRAGMSYDGKEQYSSQTEVIMTLVGMTHDIGNFISRKDHSTYSAWMLCRLFKNRERVPELWQAVEQSVLFHEEPVLVALEQSISQGIPLQWALVLADKMHVGRDRIGGRSFISGIKHKALEQDLHILLNALIVRSTWYLGVKSFTWHLDFSIDQLEKKFESFSKGNNRIWMPRFIQKLFIKEGVRYRDSFSTLFTDIYKDRIAMAAECAFLLFPYIERFEVMMVDNDTRDKVGSGKVVIWEKTRGGK